MRRLIVAATVGMLGLGQPMISAAQAAAPQADAQAAGQNAQGQYTLTVNANIVLTNVVVRDKKTGALITGLKRRR